MKLNEILATQKVDQLKSLCQKYELSGYSKLIKSKLIDLLSTFLLDEDNAKNIFLFCIHGEIELFLKLKKITNHICHEFTETEFFFTSYNAYIYFENGLLYIADEIIPIFDDFYNDEFKAKNEIFNNYRDYLEASVNLYGIVSLSKVLDIYNEQNVNKITEDDASLYLNMCLKNNPYYEVYKDYLIHKSIRMFDDETFESLLDMQMNKPFYIPPKQEFLKFVDEYYLQNCPQHSSFVKYIVRNFKLPHEQASYMCDDLQLMCNEENELPFILMYLEQHAIIPKNEKQMHEIIKLVIDLRNNSRMWSNRGHTPAELAKTEHYDDFLPNAPVQQPKFQVKIGGNAPCPCGSGKKYKKCCALNDN